MKSENTIAENDREGQSPIHSNNYNNEISSGTIGAEGGNDNGASTLRALKKKHSQKAFVKSPRKPIL
jgi:hypothetical protein